MIKELKALYFSSIAHIIFASFLFFIGLVFSMIIFYTKTADIRGLLSAAVVPLLLFAPVLTMRLFAEEKKSGTIELLMTNPIRDLEIVLGKYLSVVVFFISMTILTFVYPVIYIIYSNPDYGLFITGYTGFILLGCVYLSIGLLASTVSKNQIISAILSFIVLLVFWFLDDVSKILPSEFGDILNYISIFPHFNNLLLGKIDTSNLVFFTSFIFLDLFLTTRIIESRNWR
jgi:ABC-2 type transport system permease protein